MCDDAMFKLFCFTAIMTGSRSNIPLCITHAEGELKMSSTQVLEAV
jgi:hypothetical protein